MKDTRISKIVQNLILIFVIILIVAGGSYFYKCTYSQIIKLVTTVLLSYIAFNFSLEKQSTNINGTVKNSVIIAGYILSLIFPLIPVSLWFYPALAVLLTIVTGIVPAFFLYISMIFISGMIIEMNVGLYTIFIVSALAISIVISDAKKGRNKFISYIIIFLILLISMTLTVTFYYSFNNRIELFVLPLSNIFICILLIYCLCNYFAERNYLKKEKLYKTITDWNYPFLYELKNDKPISYIRTVHISHYSVLLGELLDLDPSLVKAGARYSLINAIFDNNKDKLYSILDDIEFPDEIINIIKEVNDNTIVFTSSESFIISLSRTLVIAIQKVKSSGRDIETVYEALISSIMGTYYNSNRLRHLKLSFEEFESIKKTLIEDKKYLKIISD